LTTLLNSDKRRFVNQDDTDDNQSGVFHMATKTASAPAAAAAATDTAKRPGAPTGPRVAPVTSAAVKIDLPIPERRGGNRSLYPFESLTEAGMAFGIKGKPAKNLSSVINNANKKFLTQERDANGTPVFETKSVPQADGTTLTVPDTEKPKMVASRKFRAVDVTPDIATNLKGTPLEGFDTLIQRTI
jgi:hypothetical protein